MHPPIVIDGQNAREVIRAVGERLAEVNAAHVASTLRGDHVTFVDMDTGDGRTEVPRPSWNKKWLSVVLTYAKERKYDGLSLVPQTHDQKSSFQTYKSNVGSVIRLCQGPRFDLENINLVESQCAISLCDGSAQQLVIDFAEKHGRDPLKSELFALLQQQLLGSISGDLTVCKKLDVLHCDDLARVMKSKMTNGPILIYNNDAFLYNKEN